MSGNNLLLFISIYVSIYVMCICIVYVMYICMCVLYVRMMYAYVQ